MRNPPGTRGDGRASPCATSPTRLERIVLRRRVEQGGVVLEPGTALDGRWVSVPPGFRGFAGWEVDVDGRHLQLEEGSDAERAGPPPLVTFGPGGARP